MLHHLSIVMTLISVSDCFTWIYRDKVSQGSFLLSVGSQLHFVSESKKIDVKLLKVDTDYFINDQYRFFVPSIHTQCYNLPKDNNIACDFHRLQQEDTVENVVRSYLVLLKICGQNHFEKVHYHRLIGPILK